MSRYILLVRGVAPEGRLVVYAPRQSSYNTGRLRTIASAARKAARDFGIKADGVFRRDALSVSVYYRDRAEERWVYSDWGMNFKEDEIYEIIRNLTFLLSHAPHPQNT